MATGFFRWSKTPASNALATYRWDEGQPPSSVNDSARGIMSDVAQWRDDIGGLLTTSGSATAYTLTSNSAYDTLANLHGMLIAFTPHATNTNTVGNDVTLAVDGLTAKPIRMQPSVALPSGVLILGTPYFVSYNNTDGAFYLQNMINPYQIPLGSGIDHWGASAPNSSFAFAYGQAISRTTYSTLFSLFGTTYGSGDGSTTFNMPDTRERVRAGKGNMGGSYPSPGRFSLNFFGTDSGVLGAVGGFESHTLTSNQLAAHQHNGTTAGQSQTHNHSETGSGTTPVQSQIGGVSVLLPGGNTTGNASVDHTHGFTTDAAGGGAAHNNVQPTIICNYIIRVI